MLDQLPSIFPTLTSLRISHNPLFDSLALEEAHMLAVARMPERVTMLNYSAITPQERANAEMYYLSRIARELAAVEEDEEETVLKVHARWEELCELHGKPVVNRGKPEKRTLANKLIGTFSLSRAFFSIPFAQANQNSQRLNLRLPEGRR
jgi:tubulin-specific chaperone E